jgi:hypothetical protein
MTRSPGDHARQNGFDDSVQTSPGLTPMARASGRYQADNHVRKTTARNPG